MKTIEERAIEYAPGSLNPNYAVSGYISGQRRAYIAGAKDQQYIDRLFIEQLIDKACEWLRTRNVLTEANIEGFREAMEE